MNFDGSKMRGDLGEGIVLISPKGDKLHYVLQIHFAASNNVAEYEALIHGLKLSKEIGIQRIPCFGDSDLMVHHVSGDWDAKDANMASYCFYIQQLCGFFEGCEFHHIPGAKNDEVDQLSKIGSTRQAIPARVSLEIIRKPSIKPSPESNSIYVPEDTALAKAPSPNPRAAGSEQDGAADQHRKASSVENPRVAISEQTPAAGQSNIDVTLADRGLQIHWLKVSSTSERYHHGRSRFPITSSLGTCQQAKQRLDDFSVTHEHTPS
jgi:ribonuclease HI